MSGNGQGTAAAVGEAVPLIFVLGAIGIGSSHTDYSD
jgi:hypothetical protein